MKKVIRLTESDLMRIVKRVIKENEGSECENLMGDMEYVFNDFMGFVQTFVQTEYDEINAEEVYSDLESSLGSILDIAYQNDCNNVNYLEGLYEAYLNSMADNLGL